MPVPAHVFLLQSGYRGGMARDAGLFGVSRWRLDERETDDPSATKTARAPANRSRIKAASFPAPTDIKKASLGLFSHLLTGFCEC